MTYPSADVQALIAAQFVPVRLALNRAEDRPLFRAYQVIWTPTIVIGDRRGVAHYQSPGFLPPDQFAAMLRVGLGRALTAWSRFDDATTQLQAVAEDRGSAWAAEALYWLGVAWYLQARKRAPMMRAWQRLRDDYPTSIWAARVPPNQEDEEE